MRRTQGRSFKEILEDKSIKWPHFCHMFSCIDEHSELAYLIMTRSEKDPVKISKFNSNQRKIYIDWKKKHPEKERIRTKEEIAAKTNGFISALRASGRVIDNTTK